MSVAANGPSEQRRRVGAVEHRWLERGSGAPVVLVHGIPTSPELWRHVLPLVGAARVLAWEMQGYGRSWHASPGVDISVAGQADHLLAWMQKLDVERAVLVGHDLGGGVVQIAAARAPQRCAGIVLTNAIAYDSWPIPEVKAMRSVGALIERLPGRLLRAQLGMMLRMGHDDRGRARESLDVHWRGYDHASGGSAFVRQLRSLDCGDTQAVAAALPALDVPAALVWGAADRFQKLDPFGRRLASDLRASLDAIDGGKHFTPEDHPERVAAGSDRVVAAAVP